MHRWKFTYDHQFCNVFERKERPKARVHIHHTLDLRALVWQKPEHYDQADFAQSEAIAMPSIRPYRKYRRFNRRYPVHVRFPSGNLFLELDAVSRNVSLCGLLLETAAIIPLRSP